MSKFDYTRGLHDLGHGCHAWLVPDGSLGFSNSGLVTAGTTSLVVDTLFDLRLTQEMLDGIKPLTDISPVETLFNTHSDGDHIWGNQLLAERGVQIIASAAAAEHMTQEEVTALIEVQKLGGLGADYARHVLSPFDFTEVVATGPDRTFEGEEALDIGGREVRLIQVGPAHTPGDSLAYVPDAKVLYAGDILFTDSTPIMWVGPIQNWIAALDLVLDLDVDVVVPGHGPISGKPQVAFMRDYLVFVEREARTRFEDGVGVDDAITSVYKSLGSFADIPDAGRVAQTVIGVYQSLDPSLNPPDRLSVLARIATLDGFGSTKRSD